MKDETKLKLAKHVPTVLNAMLITLYGAIGIGAGLTDRVLAAVLCIVIVLSDKQSLQLYERIDRLRGRLLKEELNTALEDADTATEIDANCKEIRHKIDVGYYQGR